jgi:NTP pyrophosphatase (non-canonical NTP hydrolase)
MDEGRAAGEHQSGLIRCAGALVLFYEAGSRRLLLAEAGQEALEATMSRTGWCATSTASMASLPLLTEQGDFIRRHAEHKECDLISENTLAMLSAFRRERDWEQFHNARNLAVALSVEGAELLELFLWAADGEIDAIVAEKKPRIAAEIADIAIYLTYLAQDLGIDIDSAVREKMKVNGERYPVEKARASSRKYSDL